MKRCSSCSVEKPESEFQKRAASSDGLTSSCKSCLKKRDAAKHLKFREKRLEMMRSYGKTESAKESHYKSVKKWRELNPERRIAHKKVSNAIAQGKLKRTPCCVCGDEKSEAHHEDYSKPLDVIWLCSTHHHEHHLQPNPPTSSAVFFSMR